MVGHGQPHIRILEERVLGWHKEEGEEVLGMRVFFTIEAFWEV